MLSKAAATVFRHLDPDAWGERLVRAFFRAAGFSVYRASPWAEMAIEQGMLKGRNRLSKWSWDGKRLALSTLESASTSWYRILDSELSANRRGGYSLKGNTLGHQAVLAANPNPKIDFGARNIGGVLGQKGPSILIERRGVTRSVPRGLFVGSLSPHNWFHWTVDTLPTIWSLKFLPERFQDFPIILPKVVNIRATWLEALNVVLEGRSVVWVDPDELTKVPELVVVDGLTRCHPRPIASDGGPRIYLDVALLSAYRSSVLANFSLERQIVQGSRYYLARRHDDTRG